MTSVISLDAARRFLIRHNKARAIATGTWSQIAAEWNRAFAAVEADKNAFRILPKSVERVHSEAVKERTRASMRFVARERQRVASDNQRKACKACHVVKPLEEFYEALEMRDGHEGICKQCKRARRRKYRN